MDSAGASHLDEDSKEENVALEADHKHFLHIKKMRGMELNLDKVYQKSAYKMRGPTTFTSLLKKSQPSKVGTKSEKVSPKQLKRFNMSMSDLKQSRHYSVQKDGLDSKMDIQNKVLEEKRRLLLRALADKHPIFEEGNKQLSGRELLTRRKSIYNR